MTKDQMRYLYQQGLELIPDHMREGVTSHIEHGRVTGGFLTALLEGDEFAWGRADLVNVEAMRGWATFLHKHIPADCWGTPGKAAAWRKMGGLSGLPNA